MVGLLQPSAGRVQIDGVPVVALDRTAFRRRIGVVPQDPFLFNASLRENLQLMADDSVEDIEPRIREACAIACIDDVITRLPDGLDTTIGERGCLLSGGQRQRLTLARALVHRPAILLLDEATSALDPALEGRVHANLAQLNCTRIVIAHRVATVRDADRIIVLEEGRIKQQGRYAHLVAIPGAFRELVLAGGADDA
jgi:ABC-type bacteriocin/lantibiotic exporter with double-glycine peptidase domain